MTEALSTQAALYTALIIPIVQFLKTTILGPFLARFDVPDEQGAIPNPAMKKWILIITSVVVGAVITTMAQLIGWFDYGGIASAVAFGALAAVPNSGGYAVVKKWFKDIGSNAVQDAPRAAAALSDADLAAIHSEFYPDQTLTDADVETEPEKPRRGAI